jgi:hypothetical protein
MGAQRSVGTVFVDFDANFEPVNRAQKQLLKDATTTTGNIEDAFRKLGIKSAAEYDLMRQKITSAHAAIASNAKATADDILRAEKAKAEQLTRLNEQQFGKQASLLDDLKASWASLAPAGLVAMGSIAGAVSAATYAVHASLDTFTALSNEVRDLSYISGASPEKISGLVDALGDLGISSDTVQTGIAKMSAAIESGSPALTRLGISTRDASGHQKNALVLFYETVDALGGVRGEIERNSLAREMFGKGWTSMIPIIEQGSAALKQMAAESNKVLTADDLKRAREYQLAIANLGDAVDAFMMQHARGIIIPITMAIKWLTPAGEVTPGAPPTTLEEAARMALPGLYKTQPTTYRSYGLYDDPSLHGTGYIEKPVEPMTAAEKEALEQRQKIVTENLYQSLKAQQHILDEAESFGAKFLVEEEKRKEKMIHDTNEILLARDRLVSSWADGVDQLVKRETAAADKVKKVWLDEMATRRTMRDQLAAMEDVNLTTEERIKKGLGTVGDLWTGDLGQAMGLPAEERVKQLTGLYGQLAGWGKELAQLMKPTEAESSWPVFTLSWAETAADKYKKLHETVKATMSEVARAVSDAYAEQKSDALNAWQATTQGANDYRSAVERLSAELDTLIKKMVAINALGAGGIPKDSLNAFGAYAKKLLDQTISTGGQNLMNGAGSVGTAPTPAPVTPTGTYGGEGWVGGPGGWGYNAYSDQRAAGGPVNAWTPYLVGERGPEIIVPSRPGTVLSNADSQRALGSFAPVVHIHINGAQEPGDVLARRVKREVSYELKEMVRLGQLKWGN